MTPKTQKPQHYEKYPFLYRRSRLTYITYILIDTSHLTKTLLHVRQCSLRHFLPFRVFLMRCFCGSGMLPGAKGSSEDTRDHKHVHDWVMSHGRKPFGEKCPGSDVSNGANHLLSEDRTSAFLHGLFWWYKLPINPINALFMYLTENHLFKSKSFSV